MFYLQQSTNMTGSIFSIWLYLLYFLSSKYANVFHQTYSIHPVSKIIEKFTHWTSIPSSEDVKSVPSLNRYPTELTPTLPAISYIWYLVFLWQVKFIIPMTEINVLTLIQAAWIIYSIAGIFRRTSTGNYFYQQPCAMNKWCFFYTAFGLILYTPQLAAASRNKYGIGVRKSRAQKEYFS